jgi:hypothetical protein
MRSNGVRVLLVVALGTTLLAPGFGAAEQAELPPELAEVATSGVTIDLLAAAPLPAFERAYALTLERLTPAPAPDQIVATLGPELWYVEGGTLVLTDETGAARTYQAGEQAVIPDAASYTYRIEGSDCPSVLRLALTTVLAMQVGSETPGPALGVEAARCPAAGMLFESGYELVIPAAPSFAFIARMTFPVEEMPVERTFSGPVGYAPEAGSLAVTVASSTSLLLSAGSSVVVNGNEPHRASGRGGEPATALVAGLVAAGETAPPTPTVATGVQGSTYRSPTFGYSLSWDDTWSVVTESSADGSDLLQLNNGVSDVYFRSYGDYTGDPAACVASIAEQLPANAGWSNVEPMRTAGGDPIAGGDAGRAYAVYTFGYAAGGTTTDYAEYLECRAIVPGQSVLVVTQIAPLAAYPDQVEPMRTLLDRLMMP